ncbi:acyltransferase domain-containing protein [Streptomyces sp. NPDC058326]|uniref:acyltransferase domain-containing protein n=1 Tax=Streptomyces sp. NPDC058326 TaxID=3346447 RepID=UPI0036EB6860
MSRQVVFLLPGQGSQFPGMGCELYGADAVFTETMDTFFELQGEAGASLRKDWITADADDHFDDGGRAQPLLFALGYAVARTLIARGIRPAALLGHSVGELAAAALAGVFDLPAAARFLAARSASLDHAPPGGLLGVAGTVEEIRACLTPAWERAGLVVGAINAPRQTVLAGPEDELRAAEQALRAAGVAARRARAAEPWHSPVMSTAAGHFEEAVARETPAAPRIALHSSAVGRPPTPQEAADPAFWARQMARPVLFWPALSALLDDGAHLLVEVGPGNVLGAAARSHPAVRSGRSEVLSLLPARKNPGTSWRSGVERLEQSLAPQPTTAA